MSRTIRVLPAATALALTLGACGTPTSQEAPVTETPASSGTPQESSPHTPTLSPTPETAGTSAPAPSTEDAPEAASTSRPVILPPGAPTGPVPIGIEERQDVRAAIEDLASRSGVSPEQVQVLGYADVTWSDGSLGCPEPGMMYTAALVPGHQLILLAEGRAASYHAAKGKPFAYCATPKPPSSQGNQDR